MVAPKLNLWQQLLAKAQENKETLVKIGGVLLGAAVGVAATVLVGKVQDASARDTMLEDIVNETR